jgi:hypothetical protein
MSGMGLLFWWGAGGVIAQNCLLTVVKNII